MQISKRLAISRLLGDGEEEARVYVQPGRVRADIGHTSVVSVLYEGEFVAYRNIIRTSFDTLVTVSAQQLYDSLERALLLTRDDRSNPVRFDITERTMRITSASGRGNLDERLAVLLRNHLCLEGVEKHQIHRMRDPNQWGRAIGRTSNGRAGKPAKLLIGNVAY